MAASTSSTNYLSTFSIEFSQLNELKSLPPGNFKVIEIKNCPTTLEASRLVTSTFLSLFEDLTILKLKINEKLNEPHAEKPKIHEIKIARNFLVVYESTRKGKEHQKIIYWKNGDDFITFKLIEGVIEEMPQGLTSELSEFVLRFLIENVELNLPGE